MFTSAEAGDGKTTVVANLADPGATRYIRAGFMLEMAGSFESDSGALWLGEKKPLIKNWLAIYLASQTVEDLQGERNLNRVLAEIVPEEKPTLMVFNKMDLVDEELFENRYRRLYPDAVFVSAKRPEGPALLRDTIIEAFRINRGYRIRLAGFDNRCQICHAFVYLCG